MAPETRTIKHASVPKYSQFLDIKDKKWKPHSCGIAALKMVLNYWRAKNTSIYTLLQEGLAKDDDWFILKTGWRHKTIAALARAHGLWAKNYDWIKDTPEKAFKKMIARLLRYPVIVSIYKDFQPGNSGHLVVLTGMSENAIFYNDPIAKKRNDIARKVSMKKFLIGWKRRIIVVRHKNR